MLTFVWTIDQKDEEFAKLFFSFDEGISQNSRAVKAITSATSADSRKRMIKRGEVVTLKDEVFRRLVDDDLSLTIIK